MRQIKKNTRPIEFGDVAEAEHLISICLADLNLDGEQFQALQKARNILVEILDQEGLEDGEL